MLSVHQLSKSYGIKPIFTQISFSVNPGERTALVGENGCGKTTLLRIIAGEEAADSGVVQFTPADLGFGYLPQGLRLPRNLVVGEYLNQKLGSLETISAELEMLSKQLSAHPDSQEIAARYDQALTRLRVTQENEDANNEIIHNLGLEDIPTDQPVRTLSGGQKTRLSLAGVLVNNPSLLLLDEPTNHLDLPMLNWLEDWISGFQGGVLVVSHDRAFVDQIATCVIEMEDAGIKIYPGGYSDYLETRLAEEEKRWQQFKDQQDEIAQLRQAANRVRGQAKFRKGGKADTPDGFAFGHFSNRSKGTMRRAKSLERRLEKLLTDERIGKPASHWQMQLIFDNIPPSGQDVLTINDLAIGYDGNTLLEGLNLDIQAGQRVAMIGENGCGKSTLLRTILGRIPPLAGYVRLGANVRPGYLAQEQETLDPQMTPIATIQALKPMSETDARTFLHKFLFTGDEVFDRVGALSYGERSRLGLAALVVQECNFLLLDEPLNHLDIPSRTRFEKALTGFDGTILAVVHDRYFLAHFAQIVWEICDGEVRHHFREVML